MGTNRLSRFIPQPKHAETRFVGSWVCPCLSCAVPCSENLGAFWLGGWTGIFRCIYVFILLWILLDFVGLCEKQAVRAWSISEWLQEFDHSFAAKMQSTHPPYSRAEHQVVSISQQGKFKDSKGVHGPDHHILYSTSKIIPNKGVVNPCKFNIMLLVHPHNYGQVTMVSQWTGLLTAPAVEEGAPATCLRMDSDHGSPGVPTCMHMTCKNGNTYKHHMTSVCI